MKRTILQTLHVFPLGISRQTCGLSELPRGVGKRLAARWGDKVCLLAKAMKARLRFRCQKISTKRLLKSQGQEGPWVLRSSTRHDSHPWVLTFLSILSGWKVVLLALSFRSMHTYDVPTLYAGLSDWHM